MGVPPEPIYSRSVFEAILGGLGSDSSFKGDIECDDRGVWVKHDVRIESLAWHPLCETMALGSPNPLDEPWLPFPFTARQLAAFLTDGWGYVIQDKYGEWADGPSEEELRCLGPLGGKAKECLVAAYEAYRQAVGLAPRRDLTLATAATALEGEYRAARRAAIARERVRETGISDEDYTRRVARVNDSVAELSHRETVARLSADAAYETWRKAVVQHLLLPVDQVPTEAFESSILRALPASRRAEAIYRLRVHQDFENSEEGLAQWDLICKKHDTERELREWQLKRPQNITEADIQERKVRVSAPIQI